MPLARRKGRDNNGGKPQRAGVLMQAVSSEPGVVFRMIKLRLFVLGSVLGMAPVQFAVCAGGGISLGQAMRSIAPFDGVLGVCLLLVTCVPAFSLWLPALFK